MTELELKKAQLEAVKKTLSMWSWLYEHPDERKGKFIEKKMSKKSQRVLNDCYLCEFSKEITSLLKIQSLNCRLCPVKWTQIFSKYHTPCCNGDTPYFRYIFDFLNRQNLVKGDVKEVLNILLKTKKRLLKEIRYESENRTDRAAGSH